MKRNMILSELLIYIETFDPTRAIEDEDLRRYFTEEGVACGC